jgi:hypothetical protein
MATNKSAPAPTAPASKGATSYSPAPNPRGATTQMSSGGLQKVTGKHAPNSDPEKATGSCQR